MPGVLSTKAYQDFRAEMKARWKAEGRPCWHDGQPIDYDGARNQPDSFELDHVKPRKSHPELALDPSNARPSHCRCNRSRQHRDVRAPLGATSEPW